MVATALNINNLGNTYHSLLTTTSCPIVVMCERFASSLLTIDNKEKAQGF